MAYRIAVKTTGADKGKQAQADDKTRGEGKAHFSLL
jgi:hypothetical protein